MYYHPALGKVQLWTAPNGNSHLTWHLSEGNEWYISDLDYVLVYLDDILILSNDQDTFEEHLKKVQVVFSRLHKMGMKVNLLKTEFFKDELEYLGYLLTPHGIKPLPKNWKP